MASEETVIPPFDHMPLVDRLLPPEAMHIVPHDRGMVTPTFCRLLNLTITPEEATPSTILVLQRQADRLGPGAGYHQSQSP